MNQENNQGKRRVQRQSWKPSGFFTLLKGLWTGVYSGIKIAIGAVVTVLCILIVCGVVFAWTLGDYLREDIVTQAGIQPPTFVCFCNDAKLFHFSYLRYLENQIRQVYGLNGTPVKMVVRQRGEE